MNIVTASIKQRLLIVGYGAEYHVGAHFYQAALQMGLDVQLFDASQSSRAPALIQRLNWRLRNHRPTRLDRFSQELVEHCSEFMPDIVLVTGMTPPNAVALATLKAMGIRCVNFLTDDPWNKEHQSRWFFEALPNYTHIFSPRKSNLNDLANLDCQASYLPFAYNPAIHFIEFPPPEVAKGFQCDVLFYGGADKDRVPYIEALIEAGINVHLYGGYWDRHPKTRSSWRGMANPQMLRWAVSSAKITLCLVRRANRDGHVMRTFEAPAMGACMLVERTDEHNQLLGGEEQSAMYFESHEQMVEQAQWLLANEHQRLILKEQVMNHIVSTNNTYFDRLQSILSTTPLIGFGLPAPKIGS